MATKVTFTSNKAAVQRQMEANIDRALTAVGEEAVGKVKKQMKHGYDKPIHKTGTLEGSIAHKRVSSRSEAVGTNVKYATFVHEGTSRMKGRPFLKDGILNNQKRLVKVAAETLKQGFDND